jgi:hypothetical protein
MIEMISTTGKMIEKKEVRKNHSTKTPRNKEKPKWKQKG